MAATIPFIGRTHELATIDSAIQDWGSQQIICIAGEGGIGKTRLLQEVANIYRSFRLDNVLEPPERKTIAVLYELTLADWSRQFRAGIHDMAHQLGIDLIERDAIFDRDRMVHDVRTVMAEAPDAIVIDMGSYSQVLDAVDHALQKQIPVILVENYLQQQSDSITTRILQDNHQGALRSIEYLAQDITFRGKIAVVWSNAFEPM